MNYKPERGDLVIIDDVRFKNEADEVKKRGGLLIRLNGYPGGKVVTQRNENHLSEIDLDDYTGFDIIVNTEDYINKMDELYNHIFMI